MTNQDGSGSRKPAPVLCIDGPSGSGKGTISRAVARILGWHFLDSGALYRVLGLAAERQAVDLMDENRLAELARGSSIRFFERELDDPRVLLDEQDVTEEIRSEAAANSASKVAAFGAVRSALLEKQRDLAQPPGLVADGRDMGTVVFPHAPLKIFLEASVNERALRRHKQLLQKGKPAILVDLLRELAERDLRDRTRSIAPLKPAEDAIIIDSTYLSIEEVVASVMQHVNRCGFAAQTS